ncbi:MAG: hypothetical protein EOO11_13125 [Chitinophagaceae bacterium]|nr:MAG: hypothetical protein EOO11_13125 [Chitinophagaceae bacterium]
MPVRWTQARIRRVSIGFWCVALLAFGLTAWGLGRAYRARCVETEGVVVSEIRYGDKAHAVRARKLRPQFRYLVGTDTLYSVAHNAAAPVGSEALLLVRRDDPSVIRVLNRRYWTPFLLQALPVLLGAALLFGVFRIAVTQDRPGPAVRRSADRPAE